MDFIYSRLNNNLVDINRLESITLLKCEEENNPIEGLHVGEYYLRFTTIGSDRINYCDLSQLNDDEKQSADALYEEQQRAINRENAIENNSGNYLDIDHDETTGIVTIKLLNIHGNILDTKILDLDTEKIIRNVNLDQEHKLLVFSLVDGTKIECDISDLIADYDSKILDIRSGLTNLEDEIDTLDLKIEDEISRAEKAEEDLSSSKLDRKTDITDTPQVYTKSREGEQVMVNITSGISTNDIVGRDNTGYFEVSVPTNDNHPTTKKYVDSGLKNVSDTLSADISSETSRASEAESSLQNAIDNEANTRIESESNLNLRLGSIETLVSPGDHQASLAGLVFEEI